MFPMFFFLSLYMQQVLGYSAIKTGLACLVIAAGTIVSSGAAQGLATKTGPRAMIVAGLVLLAAAQVLFLRVPVIGGYAADLLPGFILVALGLGLAFVGDVIAPATGVGPADAGLASGLINTSQQIGGAIGIAVTTTIAAARTATLLHSGRPLHVALTGGFHDAFAVAAGLAVAGAIVAFALIRRPAAVPAAVAQGNATQ